MDISEKYVTSFFDIEDGIMLGNYPGILPIPLKEGMKMTIHGQDGPFQVVNWDFHHGQPDENAGLRIHLKKT